MRTQNAKAVDVHAHAAPQRLVDEASRGLFPGVYVDSVDGRPYFSFRGMDPSPPLRSELLSPLPLVKWGEEKGISLHLMGPWTDLFGYTLSERVARDWCQSYNDALMEECAAHDRLSPVATVPLTYPRLASTELARTKENGCRAAMIGTDLPDQDLGDPSLDAFWATAAELSIPLILHPTFLRVPNNLQSSGLKNTVGRAAATAAALAKIIYAGALLRYPGLRILAVHGGGGLPGLVPRIIRNYDLGLSESRYDPRESIRRLFFDSIVLDARYLRYLVTQFGADHFVLGSDFPFPWEPDPMGVVLNCDITDEEKYAIVECTAKTLFKL